jgi:integrase
MLVYGVHPRRAVMGILPFHRKELELTTPSGRISRSASGFGDLEAVMRYSALEAEDTKTEEPRVVYLTDRILAMLNGLPRRLHCDFVFVNPATGRPWQDLQGAMERAREAAGLEGVWVHDLRRSFVTQARCSGLPESPVLGTPHPGRVQALQHRRGAGSSSLPSKF